MGKLRRFITQAIAGRSATPVVPLVATTTVLWGLAFLLEPEARRHAFGTEYTTLDTMPYWAWGALMVISGVATIVAMRPWAVGVLVFALSSYTVTLFINIFRSSQASLTAPIWPFTVVVVLVLAAGRLGVRQHRLHGGEG